MFGEVLIDVGRVDRASRARRLQSKTLLDMCFSVRCALYADPASTLDDLCEAVTTLEDVGRIARRVLGGAHPLTEGIERDLRNARAALRFRETLPGSA